jgi:hypothetical protein
LPAAVAEGATAEAVVVSTEEVSAAGALSAGAAFMVVGSMGAPSAVALSTAVVVSMGGSSAVVLSAAVAFVVAVLLGAIGVATGTIIDSLMMSSSAASAFRGGGAGAIRTDITVMTITRMITMDTAGTRMTAMDTADTGTTTAAVMDIADTGTTAAPVTDTSMAADQGNRGVTGDGNKTSAAAVRNRAPVNACRLGRFEPTHR